MKDKKYRNMNKEPLFEININELSEEGQGVGKLENGMTVFVAKALPGEKVLAEWDFKKKTYGRAYCKKIILPSDFRINDLCNAQMDCGGCALQSLDYSRQLEYKTLTVRKNLNRIGGITEDILDEVMLPIIGMNEPFRYRNKIQLPVMPAIVDKTDINRKCCKIGYYKPGSHEVIESDKCILQPEVADTIKDVFKNFLQDSGISVYDERTGNGLVRHLVIRLGFRTKEVMVAVVINSMSISSCEKIKISNLTNNLKTCISSQGYNLVSFQINYQPDKNNVILGKYSEVLYGRDYINEKICGNEYRISLNSFFQVNTVQAEKLYNETLLFLNPKIHENIYDLYCGAGSITLTIARKCKSVIGIEIVPQAVKNAIVNSQINGLENNCTFYCGAAEVVGPELCEINPADAVVLDPPRKGCDIRLLRAIVRMSPERLVYVSCHPATLARDLKFLCGEGGYKLVKVRPVDLFPHTAHVETIALIQRVK